MRREELELALKVVQELREEYEAGSRILSGGIGLCTEISDRVNSVLSGDQHSEIGYSIGIKCLPPEEYHNYLGPAGEFNEARYKALDLFEAQILKELSCLTPTQPA